MDSRRRWLDLRWALGRPQHRLRSSIPNRNDHRPLRMDSRTHRQTTYQSSSSVRSRISRPRVGSQIERSSPTDGRQRPPSFLPRPRSLDVVPEPLENVPRSVQHRSVREQPPDVVRLEERRSDRDGTVFARDGRGGGGPTGGFRDSVDVLRREDESSGRTVGKVVDWNAESCSSSS